MPSFTIKQALWLSVPLVLGANFYLASSQAQAPAAPPAGNPLALKYNTPDAKKGEALSARCAQCHGAGGVSSKPGIPGLAGQIPDYLHLQLAAFRAKLRPSDIMQGMASGLSDQDIADLTAYFTAQKPGPAWKADEAARAKGEKLFKAGDAGRNAIACQICHGADGRGIAANGVASITNLSPKYAVAVLHEFRDAPGFGGIVHPEAMRIALKPLSDADLNDLAAYISSMKP